jgi:CarD family transcriptional regulator
MKEVDMDFQVGDTVVHRNYGPGKIIDLEERKIHGSVRACYVVEIGNLTIWVPVDTDEQPSLRPPTTPRAFKKVISVLSSPGIPLPEDRQARQQYLHSRMHDGKLTSVCEVIRDLTLHSRQKKLSDNDKAILERARGLLVEEWGMCTSTPPAQVERELSNLLSN